MLFSLLTRKKTFLREQESEEIFEQVLNKDDRVQFRGLVTHQVIRPMKGRFGNGFIFEITGRRMEMVGVRGRFLGSNYN